MQPLVKLAVEAVFADGCCPFCTCAPPCIPPLRTPMQEIDPTPDTSDFEQMEWAQDSFLTELAGSIPGIDEAMSFAEVLKQVGVCGRKQWGNHEAAAAAMLYRLESFSSLLCRGTTQARQRQQGQQESAAGISSSKSNDAGAACVCY